MHRLLLLHVFTAILIVLSARGMGADEKGPCADPQTQAEINECAAEEFKKADAELNKIYNEVMSKLDNERKDQLRAAQLTWIEFRDAHCRFVNAEVAGSSMYPTLQYGCLTSASRTRVEQLKEILEGAMER